MKEFDRAAPNGTGAVKAGGNYAADLLPLKKAKADGFGTTLYLDCVEQKCKCRSGRARRRWVRRWVRLWVRLWVRVAV